MDGVHRLLDELTGAVESARAMPMSASCVVNRAEVLGLIEELRACLPKALDQAHGVLGERAAVVQGGQQEADRLLALAEAERDRLLAGTEVQRQAEAEAGRIIDEAIARADAMRAEAEHYVDGRLANFEIVLTRTLEAIARGRQQLAGRSELDDLRGDSSPVDERPLPG